MDVQSLYELLLAPFARIFNRDNCAHIQRSTHLRRPVFAKYSRRSETSQMLSTSMI